jgi:hypothetical protein
MPSWQPNWQDVPWDEVAAVRAISELRRAAEEIEQALLGLSAAEREAQESWHGGQRRLFDEYRLDATKRARALAEEYREAARRIAWASQTIRDEQLRRVAGRERWRQEEAAEERRRQ